MPKASRLQALGPHGFGLVCVILASGLISISIGMVLPLLPLRLESWGVSEFWIGFNALSASVAMLVTATQVNKLVARLGIANTVCIGLLNIGISTVLLGYTEDVYAWFFLRIFFGVGIALAWIGMELWVNAAAPTEIRGRVLAVYAGLFAAFTALGTFVLKFVGTTSTLPFLIILAVSLLTIIPVKMGESTEPGFEGGEEMSVKSIFYVAPILMVVGMMSGLGDGSAWSFLSVFGLKIGLDIDTAILVTSIHLAGAVVCQIPIGYMTDKVKDQSKLLTAVAAGGFFATAIVFYSETNSLLFWGAIFFNGGFLMGLYTIALAIIGNRFQGKQMASANAAFIMCFEIGILTGAPATGAAMEWAGPDGLLYMLCGSCLVVLVLMPWHFIRKARRKRLV